MKKGWEVKVLEDVCEVEYGTRVVQKRDGGSIYPVYGGGGATFKLDTYNRETRLLIARFAMSEQCTRFVEGKFFLNDSGLTVSAKNAALLPRFLDYQMLSMNDEIYGLARGTAQKNLDVPAFRSLRIAFPADTKEQQRIVALLDEAFAGIAHAKANAETNRLNARALFESHLQSVFLQRGEGWEKKRLGEVCELFQGLCINAKSKHLLVEKSSLPLLRIKDLRNNSVEQFVAENGCPKNAQVNESEIIYTRTGQIGLVFRGRVGVLHNNCFKIRPNQMLNNDYLFWWLQNPAFRARITTLAAKTAQPDITHALFKEQPIMVPPRAYQDQAISLIDNMREETQRLEDIYRRKLAALDELKQSLLHQAFSGAL
jgi:type I restriction enzyme S subunit